MSPTKFPEANGRFGPPEDFAESQVGVIHSYAGKIDGGSCDGQDVVVVAWTPSSEEIRQMIEGAPIFLTWFGGGLAPHMLSTNFHTATHPT